MIVITVTQTDHGTWCTSVTDLNGAPVRNPHSGTSLDMTHSARDLAWQRVGWVVSRVAPEHEAIVRTVDARKRLSPLDAVLRGQREN